MRVLALFAAVCHPALAVGGADEIADEETAIEAVVPPGQDQLLATMLGRGEALPGACSFAGGSADGPLVEATYTCPGGAVVVELSHPSNSLPRATVTDDFALSVRSGTAPPGLMDVLVARVRALEGSFAWAVKPVDYVEPGDSEP